MSIKLRYIFFSLWFCQATFAQAITTDSQPQETPNVVLEKLEKEKVFKKKDLPSDQKASPEIIYVINDKPVSREEYQKHNKKKQ